MNAWTTIAAGSEDRRDPRITEPSVDLCDVVDPAGHAGHPAIRLREMRVSDTGLARHADRGGAAPGDARGVAPVGAAATPALHRLLGVALAA